MWFQVGWGQSGLAEWSLVIFSPELQMPLKAQKLLSLREASDLARVTQQLRAEVKCKIRWGCAMGIGTESQAQRLIDTGCPLGPAPLWGWQEPGARFCSDSCGPHPS